MLKRAFKKISVWTDESEANLEIKNNLTWRALRMYNNMAICSCWMCCNDRHNPWIKGDEKLTMQERKANKVEDFDEYF